MAALSPALDAIRRSAVPGVNRWCGYGQHLAPVSEFNRRSNRAGGLQSQCRDCLAAPRRAERAPESKRCTKCGEVKPRDAFHRNDRARDGLRPDCRECVRNYHNSYRANNRSAIRDARMAAGEVCEVPGCDEARLARVSGEWFCSRHWQRAKAYKLGPAELAAVDAAQRCAWCGGTIEYGEHRTQTSHVHHDHHTGQPVAVLCPGCNTIEGRAARVASHAGLSLAAYLRLLADIIEGDPATLDAIAERNALARDLDL